jgi:hypothetical protein
VGCTQKTISQAVAALKIMNYTEGICSDLEAADAYDATMREMYGDDYEIDLIVRDDWTDTDMIKVMADDTEPPNPKIVYTAGAIQADLRHCQRVILRSAGTERSFRRSGSKVRREPVKLARWRTTPIASYRRNVPHRARTRISPSPLSTLRARLTVAWLTW